MYKKTKEKSDLIWKLFNERLTLTEICERAVCSQTTVKKALTFFDIDYDKWVREDYEQRLKDVVTLYEEGKSQTYIEQTLRLTRKTIRNILKGTEEVKYKTKSEQWLIRYKSTIDENCFDTLNEETSYWIGMLYADGHIAKNREFSIELTLHNDDKYHLERFSRFLNSGRCITKGNGNCSRVRFNSKKIYDRLVELSFTHDKSYTAVPHSLLKDSRDFWRGVVDGDGGVYDTKSTPQLFLCGTLETIFGFIIFCSKFANINDKYPSEAFGKELYQVHYYGQDAIKVATLLYENSETHLDRKYQKYLDIKDRPVQDKTKNQQ